MAQLGHGLFIALFRPFQEGHIHQALAPPQGVPGGDGGDARLGQGPLGLVHHIDAHDGHDLFHILTSSISPAAFSLMPELMV